jgi:hypothetical protein
MSEVEGWQHLIFLLDGSVPTGTLGLLHQSGERRLGAPSRGC